MRDPSLLFAVSLILSSFIGGIQSSSVSGTSETNSDKLTSEALRIPVSSHASNVSGVKLSYDEEYQIFQTDYPKRRKKRFVYYNIDSNFDVGFLVVIPITIVVPAMSNLFNVWRRRRSVDDADNKLTYDYEDHPSIQPHLDRLSAYFDLLNIPEHQCQLRAVCEFSADPSKYFPISDLVLKRIQTPNVAPSVMQSIYEQMDNSTQSPSLFQTFNRAADEGMMHGSKKCSESYGLTCKYPMDKLLSMTTLRFWRVLRSKLNFHLKDEFLA